MSASRRSIKDGALTSQWSSCGSRRDWAPLPSTRPWQTRRRREPCSPAHPTIQRLDPQQAYFRIGGAARPPNCVGRSPNLLYLGNVTHDAGAGGDREVSFRIRIDEHKTDIGRRLDLISLGAVDIRHCKDQVRLTVRPHLDRSCAHSTSRLRGQHAHAHVFNDVPDPVDVVLLAHGNAPCILCDRLPAS
jgi:hypothetical protein